MFAATYRVQRAEAIQVGKSTVADWDATAKQHG